VGGGRLGYDEGTGDPMVLLCSALLCSALLCSFLFSCLDFFDFTLRESLIPIPPYGDCNLYSFATLISFHWYC
jgi:hypothetical protein